MQWHRSVTILGQITAWCCMATSHYLNQSWLIISRPPLTLGSGQFHKKCLRYQSRTWFENYLFKVNSNLTGANELFLKPELVKRYISQVIFFINDDCVVLGQYGMGKGLIGVYSLTGVASWWIMGPCLGPAGSHHWIEEIRASQWNLHPKCQDNMIHIWSTWTSYCMELFNTKILSCSIICIKKIT